MAHDMTTKTSDNSMTLCYLCSGRNKVVSFFSYYGVTKLCVTCVCIEVNCILWVDWCVCGHFMLCVYICVCACVS